MNRHVRVWLLAVLILSSAAVPAQAAAKPRHGGLQSYAAEVVTQIRAYRALGKRADAALTSEPTEDVGPFVEKLSAVAGAFDRLATRWNAIKAPPGFGLKHRGMGGAFRLQARAFAVWADAWCQYGGNHDLALLTAAQERATGLIRSAAYLQKRWAVAFRGALMRAYAPVPAWLENMAMLKVP